MSNPLVGQMCVWKLFVLNNCQHVQINRSLRRHDRIHKTPMQIFGIIKIKQGHLQN